MGTAPHKSTTPALVEHVVAERGAGGPVLVELSDTVLGGREPDGPVVYVRVAVLGDVKAIHFREEKALREHRARGYSNVFRIEELLRVSPRVVRKNIGGSGRDRLAVSSPIDGLARA